jgi:hypothetical protein
MRPDADLKRDVEDELHWDPDIEAADVAVAVKGGVVTLTGFTRSYTQKWQAEADVKCVKSVVAVANDIEVRLRFSVKGRIRRSPGISLPHNGMRCPICCCPICSSRSRQSSRMDGSSWRVS